MNIVLTHIPGRLEGLSEALEAAGHVVVHAPLIKARVLENADLGGLRECPWWVFTSRTAVEAVAALGGFARAPERIAVVGRATARSLLEVAGRAATTVARVETAVELAQQLLVDGARGPFGWPRGERALMGLKRTLEGAGETVRDVVVYENLDLEFPPVNADVLVLASPSAARAVPLQTAQRACLVALGSSTAEAVAARGLQVHTCAQPSVRGVLEVIQRIPQQSTPRTNPEQDRALETTPPPPQP